MQNVQHRCEALGYHSGDMEYCHMERDAMQADTKTANVSEVCVASIFRVKEYSALKMEALGLTTGRHTPVDTNLPSQLSTSAITN
jgi:hypothetical protein